MSSTKIVTAIAFILVMLVVTISAPAPTNAAPDVNAVNRWLIDTRGGEEHTTLKAELLRTGREVLIDLPQVNILVVSGKNFSGANALAGDSRVRGVGRDGVKHLIRPEMKAEFFGKDVLKRNLERLAKKAEQANAPEGGGFPTDTAFSLPGLMWNYQRIKAQNAWDFLPWGFGQQSIKVGVADTGVDYTHPELHAKVDHVVDFTLTEQPNICSYFFGGPSDQELAAMYGGPEDTDWNGHGSWIGGNIAAAANGWDPTTSISGTQGIAFGVNLVALKIAQNCGSAYDSTILDAFAYAADHGIDVVSISFGGYTDRSLSYNDVTYKLYQRVVKYAWKKGTLIVASAGNEHTRIGAGGLVLSHGILSVPPGGDDYYGLYETPGGIKKVVMVSATGNVVNGASASCPGDALAAGNNTWCKPDTDAHQPFGVGEKNQLTYYSNYGPRIDFAAPGGARKFTVVPGGLTAALTRSMVGAL
jgi:lantibiotic leader peptide-processing serine protease